MQQLIALFIGAFMATTATQAPESTGRTVWDGVYSETQASRGRTVYQNQCAVCHGNDLSGTNATALKGTGFVEKWREDSVNSLFTRISTSMPALAPGTLSEQMYLDIVGYILQANAYPAGSEELKKDGLNVQVVARDGPGSVPDFSLVQMTGCLAQGPDKAWILTRATEPVRTREPGQPSAEDSKGRAPGPLGKDSYKLLYADSFRSGFNPAAHIGQKFEAKGFLIRKPEFRLSVTWLEMVSPACNE